MKGYEKGKEIIFGENRAIIVSDLMKFKDYYAIYADITKKVDDKIPSCLVQKIEGNIALIIRDKEKLMDMGLNSDERKAIYCHELGHCYSENQQGEVKGREILSEVDSDSFAVEKCDISPYVLESALAKTYEYSIKSIPTKEGLTKERVDRFVEEMKARKANVKRLIRQFEENIPHGNAR